MRSIKEVLLKQYIGAIAAGMIVAPGIPSLVQIVTMPINAYLLEVVNMRARAGGGISSSTPAFPWYAIASPIISALLYFLAASLLIRWLYFGPTEPASARGDGTPVGE